MRFHRLQSSCAAISLTFLTFASLVSAQPSRIARVIDSTRRITLTGHLHPRARLEYDQGRVSPSLELSYVTLALAPSAAQKADLDQFLAAQQDPASANYHHWLTPEEYAARFGVSDADIAKITAWLQSQGLSVAATARGHNWIAVNGTAAQIETAFTTELHYYLVNGEMNFANATDPSIPAALDGIVHAIRGLNDFRMKPAKRAATPDYTSTKGSHYLAPNDVGTIYNVAALYSAGFDGSGQTIAIAGQTQIDLADIDQFRAKFNLAPKDPQIILVPGSRSPGTVSGDLAEADLDLEWSGATARNASLIYVYARDVMTAVQYAIDQNLAPVLSLSYGSCEPETPSSDALAMRSWAQQANAQGITWFAASGDSGAADCDDSQNPGLAVDLPGSVPEVTSVGGTEFSENGAQFWNATTDANGGSVISYIPEIVWNDSAADGTPSSSGGGASIYFNKPAWQTGNGVPSDNSRHVPDISMNASADHDGYLVYTGGSLAVYGGTSVPTPVFAGLAALLNQYLVSNGKQSAPGLGNINPQLYSLAQTNPSIFHDITTGNNIVSVACGRRSITCSSTAVGYNAGAGYDQASGLGSVDAYLLVTGWTGSVSTSPKSDATVSLLSNVNTVGSSDTLYLTATVTGSPTPSGTVTFSASGAQIGSATLTGSAGKATATLAIKGSAFPLGSETITASFDGINALATISVASSSPNPSTPAINAITNAASYQQSFAPGGIMTLWGTQLAATSQTAGGVPLPLAMSGVGVLINGVAAPLYYVSSGLVNVQIPYETAPGAASVTINNNGQLAARTFTVAASGPGIFTDQTGAVVPFPSGAPGQQIAIYVTGFGAVAPPVSTGSAPAALTAIADLPAPSQPLTVSVGNAPASTNFIGITPGLVGVMQINFTIPSGLSPGVKPVIVTVGGIPSAAATVTITN
jgi:uncharacterized protein (TIGR03437 family)